MKDFRSLTVWRKAHDLVVAIYRATIAFPRYEVYGLTSQIRRAGISIPANIAEGCGRGSDADFGRFLQLGMGSASELEYHLLLAQELKYLAASDYEPLNNAVTEIKRMLAALIRRTKT